MSTTLPAGIDTTIAEHWTRELSKAVPKTSWVIDQIPLSLGIESALGLIWLGHILPALTPQSSMPKLYRNIELLSKYAKTGVDITRKEIAMAMDVEELQTLFSVTKDSSVARAFVQRYQAWMAFQAKHGTFYQCLQNNDYHLVDTIEQLEKILPPIDDHEEPHIVLVPMEDVLLRAGIQMDSPEPHIYLDAIMLQMLLSSGILPAVKTNVQSLENTEQIQALIGTWNSIVTSSHKSMMDLAHDMHSLHAQQLQHAPQTLLPSFGFRRF